MDQLKAIEYPKLLVDEVALRDTQTLIELESLYRTK